MLRTTTEISRPDEQGAETDLPFSYYVAFAHGDACPPRDGAVDGVDGVDGVASGLLRAPGSFASCGEWAVCNHCRTRSCPLQLLVNIMFIYASDKEVAQLKAMMRTLHADKAHGRIESATKALVPRAKTIIGEAKWAKMKCAGRARLSKRRVDCDNWHKPLEVLVAGAGDDNVTVIDGVLIFEFASAAQATELGAARARDEPSAPAECQLCSPGSGKPFKHSGPHVKRMNFRVCDKVKAQGCLVRGASSSARKGAASTRVEKGKETARPAAAGASAAAFVPTVSSAKLADLKARFVVGDKVDALWDDNHWYAAAVIGFEENANGWEFLVQTPDKQWWSVGLLRIRPRTVESIVMPATAQISDDQLARKMAFGLRTSAKPSATGIVWSDQERKEKPCGRRGRFVDQLDMTGRIVRSDQERQPCGRRGRFVDQLDMTGRIVRTWPSLRAAQFGVGIHESGISRCASGLAPQAGGFQWRYTDQRTQGADGGSDVPVVAAVQCNPPGNASAEPAAAVAAAESRRRGLDEARNAQDVHASIQGQKGPVPRHLYSTMIRKRKYPYAPRPRLKLTHISTRPEATAAAADNEPHAKRQALAGVATGSAVQPPVPSKQIVYL
jgi:hypothetical protein